MTNIRVFFSKKDRAKYISHLDMYRCFQRAISRADIPVWYTEGFHPQVYMTFPLPLSLGYESEQECVDIRLVKDMKFAEIRRKLTESLPLGIDVIYVSEQNMNQSEVTFADYIINMSNTDKKSVDFVSFWNQDSIIIEKLSKKKKIKQIDLKTMCDLLESSDTADEFEIKIRCKTGITENLNPKMIIDKFFGQDSQATTSVIRTAIYNQDMQIFK